MRMRRCQSVSAGSVNALAAAATDCTCQSPSASTCANEYAASARVAAWDGSSSRSSAPAGWLIRSPSIRATDSVPVPGRGWRPAAFSVDWIARAASPRAR